MNKTSGVSGDYQYSELSMKTQDSITKTKAKLEKSKCTSGCCDGHGSDLCSQIRSFLMSQMKYLFYYLEIVLIPLHFYRYFFKYGDYS